MAVPTKEEMIRSLEERHGRDFHRKMSVASVAVCGLGGLGSNIAIALARAGIGRLHIIDFDTVDISNLNRQQYFADQTGEYKTKALSDILLKIAPYCQVTADCVKLTEANIPDLLKNDGIICEAFDSAEQKAMLVNCVLETFPEKYLISGSGMAGTGSANLIRTRKVTSHFVVCGDEESDVDEAGSLVSARVMLCAAHEALAAINFITKNEEDPHEQK